ncbi:hypothetical protein DIPPA_11541 [Diplonema papillatum]|nr:hypothetical protein DIPPA_15668 [Diplonema papillatum]KAJ9450782.1 hypothetical protein DIPPA_11541 [Diplonema papillatum]
MSPDDLVVMVSPPLYSLPCADPYCLALEAAMRMGGTPFKKEADTTDGVVPRFKNSSGRKGQTARSGFLDIVGSSLSKRSGLAKTEAGLSPMQRQLKAAFTRLCENHLAPAHRWLFAGTSDAWRRTQQQLRPHTSFLGWFGGGVDARYRTMQQAILDKKAVTAHLDKACTSIRDQLGQSEYLLDTKGPSLADAVVFGFLGTVLYATGVSCGQLSFHITSNFPTLVEYMERIRMRFFELYSRTFYLRQLDQSPPDEEPAAAGSCCSATTCAAVTFSAGFCVFTHRDVCL